MRTSYSLDFNLDQFEDNVERNQQGVPFLFMQQATAIIQLSGFVTITKHDHSRGRHNNTGKLKRNVASYKGVTLLNVQFFFCHRCQPLNLSKKLICYAQRKEEKGTGKIVSTTSWKGLFHHFQTTKPDLQGKFLRVIRIAQATRTASSSLHRSLSGKTVFYSCYSSSLNLIS